MTKSTITREQLHERARENVKALKMASRQTAFESAREEILADLQLAELALDAMDSSESVELPLDYLQGHKDGLEWAAQLAEANHPETGDWLYDDPIELSKAIRKGRDMPPVQPVADSEPVAWTWNYREQWHVTNDERRAEFVAKDGDVAVLPLYRHAQPAPEYPEVLPCSVLLEPGLRFGKGIKTSTMLAALARRAVHESDMAALSSEERAEFQALIEDFKALIAQPAPVVPDDVLDALQKVARIRLDMNDFDGDRRGIAECLSDAEEALIEVVNRRAAMLQASPVCTCPSGDGSLRWPCPVHPGSSPAIPDGYVMVPKEATLDMLKAGAKQEMKGEAFQYVWQAMLAAAPQEVPDGK